MQLQQTVAIYNMYSTGLFTDDAWFSNQKRNRKHYTDLNSFNTDLIFERTSPLWHITRCPLVGLRISLLLVCFKTITANYTTVIELTSMSWFWNLHSILSVSPTVSRENMSDHSDSSSLSDTYTATAAAQHSFTTICTWRMWLKIRRDTSQQLSY